MHSLFEVVRLKRDRRAHGLRAGDTGTIVLIHRGTVEAYEVEFVDEDGSTRALLPLRPDEFETANPR